MILDRKTLRILSMVFAVVIIIAMVTFLLIPLL